MWKIDPWLALGVFASTAATDAVYVMFNAAVSSQRRIPAATWSSVWYLLSAFAVISYTKNWAYVCFAALRILDRSISVYDLAAQTTRSHRRITQSSHGNPLDGT